MRSPSYTLLLVGVMVSLIIAAIILSNGRSDNQPLSKRSSLPERALAKQIQKECKDLQNEAVERIPPQTQCFINKLTNLLTAEHAPLTFKVAFVLSQIDPGFNKSCSPILSGVGKKVQSSSFHFELFSSEPYIALCNYGFIVTLIENLASSKTSQDLIRRYCSALGGLENAVPGIELECYRGAGRGLLAAVLSDKKELTEDTLNAALQQCEQLTEREKQRAICMSGIFGALEIWYSENRQSVPLPLGAPLLLCQKLPSRYRAICYDNVHKILLALIGRDGFKTTVGTLENFILKEDSVPQEIREDILASAIQNLMYGAAEELISNKNYDYTGGVEMCDEITPFLRSACITGFALGLTKRGPSTKQFEYVMDFCAHAKELSEEERDSCTRYVLPHLWGLYPPEEFQKKCKALAKGYESFCENLAKNTYY